MTSFNVKKWLIKNWKWLAPIVTTIGVVVTIIPLVKNGQQDNGRHSNIAMNISGQLAQGGEGSTITMNSRDPMDQRTIAALIALLGTTNSANVKNDRIGAMLIEQVNVAVLDLDRISVECFGSSEIADEAKKALRGGDLSQAEWVYGQFVGGSCSHLDRTSDQILRAYRSMGILTQQRNTGQALSYFRKAIELKNDPIDWFAVGTLSFDAGAYIDSAEAFQKSITAFEKQSSTSQKLLASAYAVMGVALHRGAENKLAEAALNTAIKLQAELGDEQSVATSNATLGRVLIELNRIKQGLETMEKWLAFEALDKPSTSVVGSYISLGMNFRQHGYSDRATETFNKAAKLNNSLSANGDVAKHFSQLGHETLDQSVLTAVHVRRAIDLFNRSITIYKALGLEIEVASNSAMTGELYKMLNEINNAIAAYSISLDIFSKLDVEKAKIVSKQLKLLNSK